MLVANPGQTPYSLISKKPCHNKPARNNAVIGSSIKYTLSSATNAPSTSAVISKTTALTTIHSSNKQNALKTLSVRITRETDLLKHTVQKALISKVPSHFSSVLSLYTVPPTTAHRFPERSDSIRVENRVELYPFNPLDPEPTTPISLEGATIKKPKAKRAAKEEQDCHESERPKLSSNLSAIIGLASPRASAFSYFSKISTHSEINLQHKAKTKRAYACSKRNEENLVLGKDYAQPRVLVKHIASLSDTKVKEEVIHPTSNKRSTRHFTKASTTTSLVEQHNGQPLAEGKTRVTRKRQHISRNDDSVPTKNAKLSKDCSKPTKSGIKRAVSTGKRRPSRRTPPVTRSRLKQGMILTRKQYQNK